MQLVVGHSHSFDAPILRARELIDSGDFGALRMIHALNYTDLHLPPAPAGRTRHRAGRRRDVQPGARIRSTSCACSAADACAACARMTGNWDPARPTEGAYSALLTFEDGAFASCTYSGYAHFDSDEFSGLDRRDGPAEGPRALRREPRRRCKSRRTPTQEAAMKAARNYGGSDYVDAGRAPSERHAPAFRPRSSLSCERADLRPGPGRRA